MFEESVGRENACVDVVGGGRKKTSMRRKQGRTPRFTSFFLARLLLFFSHLWPRSRVENALNFIFTRKQNRRRVFDGRTASGDDNTVERRRQACDSSGGDVEKAPVGASEKEADARRCWR